MAAALGGVPGGPRHDLADVPLGVVVGEDRVLDAGRAAAAGAAGAQHRGGGVDGVGRVVGAERLAGVGVDGELAEGGGLELHRAFGAGAVGTGVDAGQARERPWSDSTSPMPASTDQGRPGQVFAAAMYQAR